MLKQMIYLLTLSSCGYLAGCNSGSSSSAGSGDDSNLLGYQVSGQVRVVSNIAHDNDVNDSNAPTLTNNNSINSAQQIPNPVMLGGYVNRPNTGEAGKSQRFGDINDFYRADLIAGQSVNLFVADANFSNDVDLLLLNSQGQVLNASVSDGQVESLTVPSSGQYFIQIHAQSGASNYNLNIGQSTSLATSGMTLLDEFVPYEAIIKMDEMGSQQGMQALHNTGGTASHDNPKRAALLSLDKQQTRFLSQSDFSFSASELEEKYNTLVEVKKLRQQQGVESADPNYIKTQLAAPNDNFYHLQWHYPLMNLPQAWDITQGSGNVVVAVIDTGVVLNHPDLRTKLVSGYDFIRDTRTSLDGDGIDPSPNDPGDQISGNSSYHGSHVAGTVGAATNNREGVAGVGWHTKVMPLRVLGKGGSGTDYDIEQAIRFAAGLSNDSGTTPVRRADIINLSLGGPTISNGVRQAITAARNAGVIITGAAGNNGTSTVIYPASLPEVISVSAVNIQKQRAPYSNFNSRVDVAAPGGDNSTPDINGDGYDDGILSTVGAEQGGNTGFSYSFSVGTSMAAPHMAGVIALMKAVYPDLSPQQVDELLRSGNITEDLGDRGKDSLYGYGLINAQKAVNAAIELNSGVVNEPNPLLTASPNALNFGTSLSSANLTLANAGGGNLSVQTINVQPSHLIRVESVSTNSQGIGEYRVVINRSGLSTGTYTANITITSSVNTLRIPVIFQVAQQQQQGNAGHHYILLVDPQTTETIKEVRTVASNASYPFSFNNVPQGEYIIIAGTDFDNDGFICDEGEACGAYLTLANRTRINVSQHRSGLNFNTGFNIVFRSLAMGDTLPKEKGFARLSDYKQVSN